MKGKDTPIEVYVRALVRKSCGRMQGQEKRELRAGKRGLNKMKCRRTLRMAAVEPKKEMCVMCVRGIM